MFVCQVYFKIFNLNKYAITSYASCSVFCSFSLFASTNKQAPPILFFRTSLKNDITISIIINDNGNAPIIATDCNSCVVVSKNTNATGSIKKTTAQ